MILIGEVVSGCGHFKERMTTYREVFKQVTGEYLRPGTINVDVGEEIEIRAEFRITGREINDPVQDYLFEPCRINGYSAYRIRPYSLRDGSGGHGDHILEIACPQEVPNVDVGKMVEIELRE